MMARTSARGTPASFSIQEEARDRMGRNQQDSATPIGWNVCEARLIRLRPTVDCFLTPLHIDAATYEYVGTAD